MNVAWGITGAGHYLKESFSSMETAAKKSKVTAFISKGGEEVVKAYGLWKTLKKISPGGYLQEAFTQGNQGASAPSTGRFFLGKYSFMVVSPATTNTVAKIANGIADTLVTNAVSSAMKSMTPVYICPVDRRLGEVRTALPYYIDKSLCKRCSQCLPAVNCERGAIKNYSINLLLCDACGACVEACDFNAVIGGRDGRVNVRRIDRENVKKIAKMEFIKILKHPKEILTIPELE